MATASPHNSLLAPSPEEFERQLLALVNETAPKMFAIVHEYDVEGWRDAEVVAWGLAYEDGKVRLLRARSIAYLDSAERALAWCERLCGGPTRLVWLGADGR
jgi:hypothetical protein